MQRPESARPRCCLIWTSSSQGSDNMDRLGFHRDLTRRNFFLRGAAGFGAIALSKLLADEKRSEVDPLAPKQPHFPAKAKNIIFLFMEGAPSQLDLFDPKPALQKWAGKPLPPSITKELPLAFIK